MKYAGSAQQGGFSGFFCNNQCAPASTPSPESVHGAFKGVDLAVYNVFTSYCRRVGIHPMVSNQPRGEYGDLAVHQ